jgi:hypothetical protein
LRVDELLETEEEGAGRLVVGGVDNEGDALVAKCRAVAIAFGRHWEDESVSGGLACSDASALERGEGIALERVPELPSELGE